MGRNRQPRRRNEPATKAKEQEPVSAELADTPKKSWWTEIAPWPRWVGLLIFIIPTATSIFSLWLNYKPGTRGWIAPIKAELGEPLQVGKAPRVLITLENTGAEPAFDVFTSAGGGITMPFSAAEAAQQQRTGPFGGSAMNACAGKAPKPGYPSLYPGKSTRADLAQESVMTADADVLSGGRTFFVHGCSAYNSGGANHTSEFCFYLGPNIEPATGLRLFQPCLGSFTAD
jgi:hypothetical protein